MRARRNGRRAGAATLLVLGLLFLRTLMPAGVMLAPVDGRLTLVVCDAEMAAAAGLHAGGTLDMTRGEMPGMDMPGMAMPGMDMAGMHRQPGDPRSAESPASPPAGLHADPTCPYAQSAGTAPLPTLPALARGTLFHWEYRVPDATQTHLQFGPVRRPTSRGPPTLS